MLWSKYNKDQALEEVSAPDLTSFKWLFSERSIWLAEASSILNLGDALRQGRNILNVITHHYLSKQQKSILYELFQNDLPSLKVE